MNLVESKYKNPDKYIERLKENVKQEQAFKESLRKELITERGEDWYSWTEGVFIDQKLQPSFARASHVEQEVIFQGKIVGYRKEKDIYIATIELNKTRLLKESK